MNISGDQKNKLFDKFGNIKITSTDNSDKIDKVSNENKRLNKTIGTIEAMSFISLLWIFGCFYSFVIEKNNNVGYVFLSLITITLIYFIYIIWRNK